MRVCGTAWKIYVFGIPAKHDEAMLAASEIFNRAVPVIGQIKENIVDYLTGKKDKTEQLPVLFSLVADIMKAGFEALPMYGNGK